MMAVRKRNVYGTGEGEKASAVQVYANKMYIYVSEPGKKSNIVVSRGRSIESFLCPRVDRSDVNRLKLQAAGNLTWHVAVCGVDDVDIGGARTCMWRCCVSG